MQQEEKVLSFTASLPLTGIDILLVGPFHYTQPLASSLLHVKSDENSQGWSNSADPAIEALRKHCCSYDSPMKKRHIHTLESLSKAKRVGCRFDHVVLVTSSKEKQKNVIEAKQMLHDNYIVMQRVSLVEVQETENANYDMTRVPTQNDDESSEDIDGLIPTFSLHIDDQASFSAISRIIIQRAKLGIRDGSSTLPHVSPLIFADIT